jgi:hypothetical protein
LPLGVRKNIAKEIKQDAHELSPWTLAGNNWRNTMKDRFDKAISKRANTLNTPKASQIRLLYSEMLDIEDITECWHWEYYDNANACNWINHLVEMRGSIAHGRPTNFPAETVRLILLHAIVSECAVAMNNHVCETLEKITKKLPWAIVRSNRDWTKLCKPVESDQET